MGLMQSKIATLKTLTSATGSVNELEWKWLSDLNSDTTLTLEGQWLKYLSGLGYTGTVDEMKIASWKALGYSGSINELEEQFWAGGGTYV